MQTSIKDFQVLSKLGEGAFSCVFKVKRLSDNNEYALKKVKMTMLSEKEKENALNEVRILASISNPYIIAYKEAFFDESSNSLCVIMEYANGGDIQKKITEKIANKTLFTEPEIWKALSQMVKGLKTLHEMQILHRDLKCANIFLTNSGDIKLGDLNVSKVAKKGLVYTQTGTPYYASPEVWRDQPYDMKSDIWSLGCVVYEMVSLKPPFRANDMQGLFNKVQKGLFERIPLKFSNDLAGIIGKCLQVNPNSRPTCDQLATDIANFVNNEKDKEIIKPEERKAALLQTIKLPKNMKLLQEKLPKANYQKKPANEMENLYSPSIDSNTHSRQRVLSAGVKRADSNQDLKNNKSPLIKPLESASNNQILIKRNPEPSYNNYNLNQKPQPQILQKNVNNGIPLPPRPANNNINNNNQPKIMNNIQYHQQPNIYSTPQMPVKNASPMNINNNNPNIYSRDRPISRVNTNNSRENSRERKEKVLENNKNARSDHDIKKLEEKIAIKEKNIGKNIFNNNDDLLQKYKEIVNAPGINQVNNNVYKAPANDLKKYYEEKKIEGPKISKVGSKDFPNPSLIVKNTPKSTKNSENLAAGQYLHGNRISKPSWWG